MNSTHLGSKTFSKHLSFGKFTLSDLNEYCVCLSRSITPEHLAVQVKLVVLVTIRTQTLCSLFSESQEEEEKEETPGTR